jgi:hypothetical protein
MNADELRWYRLPGEVRAHAFVDGPGWLRSLCLAVHWTVHLRPASSRARLCRDCVAAIDARRPIEPAMDEIEAAAAFGDR